MKIETKALLKVELLLAITLTLALALPFLRAQATSGPQIEGDDQILLALQSLGYDVTSVQLDSGNVQIAYRQSALQDQATHPYRWLDMMATVLEFEPGAGVITINVDYLEEPFFSVSARGSEIQAVLDGVIMPPEFFDGLWFTERRNLDSALRQEIQHLGYPYTGYTLEGNSLRIPMTAAPMEDEQRILAVAIEIARLAASKAPDIDTFVISFSSPYGDQIRLSLHRSSLEAFERDEMAALALIAAMEVEVEPAALSPSPFLGRFLAGLEAMVAMVACIFYGVVGWRRRRWSLALKGFIFIAFPALFASIGMLLLIP